MSSLLDSVGHEISLGSKLSYPVRKGSNMWVEMGTVESVSLSGSQLVAKLKKENGRKVSFKSFDRSVVIQG